MLYLNVEPNAHNILRKIFIGNQMVFILRLNCVFTYNIDALFKYNFINILLSMKGGITNGPKYNIGLSRYTGNNIVY